MNSQTITDTSPASQGYFAGDVKPDKPAIACVTAAHPRKKTSERCVWGYCCNLRSGVPCIFCRGGPSRHDKNISDAWSQVITVADSGMCGKWPNRLINHLTISRLGHQDNNELQFWSLKTRLIKVISILCQPNKIYYMIINSNTDPLSNVFLSSRPGVTQALLAIIHVPQNMHACILLWD